MRREFPAGEQKRETGVPSTNERSRIGCVREPLEVLALFEPVTGDSEFVIREIRPGRPVRVFRGGLRG